MFNPAKLSAPTRARWWLVVLSTRNPGREIDLGLLARLAKTDRETVRQAVAPLVARGHVLTRRPVYSLYWRPWHFEQKPLRAEA